MGPASSVFLSWAGPPLAPDDPRLGCRGPVPARRPPGWPEHVADGPGGALDYLRQRIVAGEDGVRLIVNGGDPPELLAAVDAGFRRLGDELVLIPPTVDGTPDPEALTMALASGPPRRGALVLGAVTPTGAVLPLADLAALCRRHAAAAILDVTLARWAPLAVDAEWRPAGILGALDRWEGGPHGVWGAAVGPVLDRRLGTAPGSLVQLDATLRDCLAEARQVTVWPLRTPCRAPGVVAFALSGWNAEEAGALLGEAFGVAVESRGLTAAPLPFPQRLGTGFLRASLASCSTVAEVYALADAVARLASRRPLAGLAH